MKKLSITVVALVASLTFNTAFAGPKCTTEPQANWMTELDMQKKIVNEYGFTINKFKVTSGNCYEIYGTAPKSEGNSSDRIKTEIYFHPISGDIVKQKVKS